jgi:hypothetical protein
LKDLLSEENPRRANKVYVKSGAQLLNSNLGGHEIQLAVLVEDSGTRDKRFEPGLVPFVEKAKRTRY